MVIVVVPLLLTCTSPSFCFALVLFLFSVKVTESDANDVVQLLHESLLDAFTTETGAIDLGRKGGISLAKQVCVFGDDSYRTLLHLLSLSLICDIYYGYHAYGLHACATIHCRTIYLSMHPSVCTFSTSVSSCICLSVATVQVKALVGTLSREAKIRGNNIFSRADIGEICARLRIDKDLDSLIDVMRTECYLLLKGPKLYQLMTTS